MLRQHLARIGAGNGRIKHLAERGAGGCIGECHGKFPLFGSCPRRSRTLDMNQTLV
jgi:hypothetical protein